MKRASFICFLFVETVVDQSCSRSPNQLTKVDKFSDLLTLTLFDWISSDQIKAEEMKIQWIQSKKSHYKSFLL